MVTLGISIGLPLTPPARQCQCRRQQQTALPFGPFPLSTNAPVKFSPPSQWNRMVVKLDSRVRSDGPRKDGPGDQIAKEAGVGGVSQEGLKEKNPPTAGREMWIDKVCEVERNHIYFQ